MTSPVDEERRRPVHAASNAAQEVLVDQIGVDVLGEPLAEQVEIEVGHPSVGVEIVGRKALVSIAAKIGEHARPQRCWSVKMSWEASDPRDVVSTEFRPVELKGTAEPLPAPRRAPTGLTSDR